MTALKKKGFNRFIIGILIFSLAVSLFFNYQYFKEKQEKQSHFQTFLNHYYFAAHESLATVNRLLDLEHSEEQINRDLILLSEHLNRFSYISSSAAYYADAYPSGTNLFEMTANIIMLGTEYNGEQIPPFIENKQLTKSESAYLTEIKKHLEYIHAQLYSEETGQENRQLSKDEFRSIGEYVTRIGSTYTSLLEKYLEN